MSREFLFLGTHILEGRLTPRLLAAFETGVQYQIYHALALDLVKLNSQVGASCPFAPELTR